jgi:hypothetical protein
VGLVVQDIGAGQGFTEHVAEFLATVAIEAALDDVLVLVDFVSFGHG